jgi:hypothetical protein
VGRRQKQVASLFTKARRNPARFFCAAKSARIWAGFRKRFGVGLFVGAAQWRSWKKQTPEPKYERFSY